MNERRTNDDMLLARLRRDAATLAGAFGLTFRSIGKTRRDARIYGCCDNDGNIRIRLRSRLTDALLKYSSLVATLCHELAHLRHFDHGREFTRLYRQLLDHARRAGIYSPAGAGTKAPPVVARAVSGSLAAAAPRRRRGTRPRGLTGARRAGSERDPRRSR